MISIKISNFRVGVASAILSTIIGCGGSTNSVSVPKFTSKLFVANFSSGSVDHFGDMSGANPKAEIVNTIGNPLSCCFDSKGNLLVGTNGGKLVSVPYPGATSFKTFGSPGTGVNQFGMIQRIATDSKGRIYIADIPNQRIVRINDMNGNGWKVLDLKANSISNFDMTPSIALDSQDHIYVLAKDSGIICEFDNMDDTIPQMFGLENIGKPKLKQPLDIAIDTQDRIYIADSGNNRIVRISNIEGWDYVELSGNAAIGDMFTNPSSVSIDKNGQIYVFDKGAHRIVRMNDMAAAGWMTFGDVSNFPGIANILVR
jgi:streptogramin lyase